MSLRKPTQMLRRTVDETGRVLVWPEEAAPAGAERRVQIILPESPQTAVAVGPHPEKVDPSRSEIEGVDNAGAYPEDIAEGRHYQWPVPDSGNTYDFCVTREQWVAAVSKEGIATITVIVEHLAEGG